MTILEQTDEWYEARRAGITSTDIVAILGLSRYASEGDIAREKGGVDYRDPDDVDAARRMRLGQRLQDAVKDEEEVEHGIKLRRVRRLITHPTIPWAMTSLDYERVGERCIVEVKTSSSRDWDDGLPERVEAQVRWQMGVARYPAAHIAALRFGNRLACFDIEHDETVFANLVFIAEDFRRRLDAGGPFDENRGSMRRAWPYDDGSEMSASADPDLVEAVRDLLRTRTNKRQIVEREEALEEAIKMRMGAVSVLTGPGFRVTWRRAKDSTVTAWEQVARGLLATLPPEDRDALVSIQTRVREGSRRFVVREVNGEESTR